MTALDAHNRFTPQGAPATASEADALEAWLESVTSPRHVRRGDPAWSPAPSPSPNGSVNADRSLKESAAHAHAMIASTERETGPEVPVDAIWEKIMASTTPHPTTSGTAANQRHPERSRGISRRGDDSRARPISAWLSGSHWAVSTLMLAAVVVGIVALYNSFAGTPGSPGNDPAINPGIAMASPDETQTSTASSSPSADAAWLQPISPDECDVEPRALEEVGALVQDPGQVPPREYLPATGVEPSLAQEVADAQRAWEACHASGLLGERRALESLRYIAEIWPHDVLSYTNSETFDEWVALNEVMRAAFLDPDIESYLVESEALPAYDCETGYPAPDETDLSSQMAYQVIQPHHLVQLPDGRIGGPVSSLVGPGFVHCLSENPPAVGGGREGTTVHIFAEDPTRGGRWALDEQFGLCVSGCDAYYEEIASLDFVWPATPVATPAAATPAATPSTDVAWLAPISPDECVVEPRTQEEVATFIENPGETVPRDYDIVGPADPALAADISGADRVWRSCGMYEGAVERRSMESPRYIHQESPNAFANVSLEEQQATYRAMRYLSEEVISQDYLDYRIDSDTFRQKIDAFMGDEAFQRPESQGSVMAPGQIVVFADGRIGGPVSIVRNPFPEGFDPEVNNDYWMVEFHIYSQDPTRDSTWVLDQRLDLCIGECDIVWTAYELASGTSAIDATLPATTSADAASLQPIHPEECTVEPLSDEKISAIIREPVDEMERSYAPTGPVEDALADEIAGADRAWQSCFVFGTAGERAALQSPRFTREGPGPDPIGALTIEDELAQLAQFDARRELSEAMLTGDWRDYLIESDLFAEGTPATLQIPDFIPTIPIPDQATLLTDGRVAIPIARLDPPGTYPHSLEDVDDIPYWWIPVHVLAQDPTQGGRWVIDETFTVCMGDCDLARAQTVDYIAYLESLVTTPDAATPAATPVASRRAHS